MKNNTAHASKSSSPKLPASKVTHIADAKPKATAKNGSAPAEEKKGNPNKLTATKVARVLSATTKRLNRLAAFFDPRSDIATALHGAASSVGLAATAATTLPDDWKPIRSQTARSFAALTQGGKARIAKGLVEKYVSLLDDEDGETPEEKMASLAELLLVKLGEKNSVVRTANGTRFAINTRHLRTV